MTESEREMVENLIGSTEPELYVRTMQDLLRVMLQEIEQQAKVLREIADSRGFGVTADPCAVSRMREFVERHRGQRGFPVLVQYEDLAALVERLEQAEAALRYIATFSERNGLDNSYQTPNGLFLQQYAQDYLAATIPREEPPNAQ